MIHVFQIVKAIFTYKAIEIERMDGLGKVGH